ncbi:MAG: apolipoprotein N-acyltransferase [Flavobacteriaceae bacterium]|nr:apolipoprotein N-acyltransferase [Flavobacteriaceae bacterium]
MKYILLSILSGVLFSISWPTYGFPFFIFLAFVPLLYISHNIDNQKNKYLKIFGLSYLSFFIWNVATTGWLYNAQNPDGSPALLAAVIPVLANSFLMTTAFLQYFWFKRKQNIILSLVFFIAIWMSFEKLHLSWEFTWPWLNLGNVFANYPKIIQWYDTIGATGGSFWILLINSLIFYVLFVAKKENIKKVGAIALGVIFIPMLISLYKYYYFDEKPLGKVKVMMLQPNLDPYKEKYKKDSLQIVQELLDLTKENEQKIDYYLAPETAFPGRGGISERGLKDSESIAMVKQILDKNSIFVGGLSIYKTFYNEDEKTETAQYLSDYDIWWDSYNSAIQILSNQEFNIYHKSKLVPGVEIFPYMNILKPVLGDAMLDFGGTVASLGIDKERKVFTNKYHQGSLAPIICYESIYGEYCTEYVRKGANFLAIMTNDSWWGVSQGHQQLLAYARLRAIETRREIARSANSGISAHIDAKGEILAQTNYGEKDILVSDIQLYNKKTIYTQIGDIFSKISLVILGILLIFRLFKRKK